MEAPDLTCYFFHVHDGTLIEDPDGSDLADLDAARALALHAARELWADAMMTGHDFSDARIEITNEAGERLAVVPLVEALPEGLQKRLVVR